MKKLLFFLVLSATNFNNLSFAAKPSSTKKEKKIVVSEKQKSKDIGARAKPISGGSKKTGGEKKTVMPTTVAAASASAPKIGKPKNAFVATKYAVANYDPSEAIEKETIDKIEALNIYTEDVLKRKAAAYFIAQPKAIKKDAIKGFIDTFAANHFETYKRHYLAIEKDYATKQRKLTTADVRNAFNASLALIKFRLEDEYVPCCTIM